MVFVVAAHCDACGRAIWPAPRIRTEDGSLMLLCRSCSPPVVKRAASGGDDEAKTTP